MGYIELPSDRFRGNFIGKRPLRDQTGDLHDVRFKPWQFFKIYFHDLALAKIAFT